MPTFRITAQHMFQDKRIARFVEATSGADAMRSVGKELDDAHYYPVSCDPAAPIIERDLAFWRAEVERLKAAAQTHSQRIRRHSLVDAVTLQRKLDAAIQIRDGLADYLSLMA